VETLVDSLKLVMQVYAGIIGYGIIENENRVTGKSKIPQKCGFFLATGDTYLVVGRLSNLVS
jgi:hypothetical protein